MSETSIHADWSVFQPSTALKQLCCLRPFCWLEAHGLYRFDNCKFSILLY